MPDIQRSSRPLNVAIDANPLLSSIRSGVPFYVESLSRTLLEGSEKDMGFLFTGATEPATLRAAFTERELPVAPDRLIAYRSFYHVEERQQEESRLQYIARTATDRVEKKVRKTLDLPPRIDRKIDVYHHSDYVAHDWAGMKNCRHVMTLHDMIPVRFPEVCRPDWLWFAERAYTFAKNRADAIITYSLSSRNDILEHLKLPEDRVQVIPLAARSSLLQSLSPEKMTDILSGFGLQSGRFLLAVGRLDPLKNLERLVEAFSRVAHEDDLRDTVLVLTGPRSDASRQDGQKRIEDTLAKNNLTERCLFTGFVSDEQLSTLMRNCLVFIYPSLFEGFGLPVLEAMAQGAAVITSRVSSLPEVAGDAALMVDPYSVEEIADAIQQVVRDPARTAALRQAALKQASHFSWEKTAAEHRSVYRGEPATAIPALSGGTYL